MKTTKSSTFKKRDTVTWTSQASGVKKKKTGKVVTVLPALHTPNDVASVGLRLRDRYGWLGRDHRSYIVDVKGKLYWPLVST